MGGGAGQECAVVRIYYSGAQYNLHLHTRQYLRSQCKQCPSFRHLTQLHKFTLFFACMVASVDHPGLTNDFLVQVKHPRAIR